MKLFCNIGWHNWETLNSEELRVDSFELFGKLHEDVRIGTTFKQKCRKCGKERQKNLFFSQSEIVLHMLREVNDDLRRTNEKMKDNNKRLREIFHKLKSTNSDPNEKLRKSVERMNEAVKSLKDY